VVETLVRTGHGVARLDMQDARSLLAGEHTTSR
jgi:hypothetical protein